MPSRSEAIAIYQRLLDEIGAAVDAADFAVYAMHFSLPHPMQTAAGETVVQTEEDLRQVFDSTCNMLALRNLNGLTRICTIADYADAQTIRGSHETWLMSPANEIRERYAALSTLRWRDGAWRVADSQYDGSDNILPCDIVRQLSPRKAPKAPHD